MICGADTATRFSIMRFWESSLSRSRFDRMLALPAFMLVVEVNVLPATTEVIVFFADVEPLANAPPAVVVVCGFCDGKVVEDEVGVREFDDSGEVAGEGHDDGRHSLLVEIAPT